MAPPAAVLPPPSFSQLSRPAPQHSLRRAGSDNHMSLSDVMTISFFMAISSPCSSSSSRSPASACSAARRARGRGVHLVGVVAPQGGPRRGGDRGAAAGLVPGRQAAPDQRRPQRPAGVRGVPREFEDDDSLRLLPTCPHAFHPVCIGLWLEKHVTCPLCRASVLDPPAPVQLEELQPPSPLETPSPPQSPPVHDTVVLIDGPGRHDEDRERIRVVAVGMRRESAAAVELDGARARRRDGAVRAAAAGARSPGDPDVAQAEARDERGGVRARQGGSAHDMAAGGNSVRNAMARLASLFAPGAGWKGDDEEISGGSSRRRRDDSARGAAEDKRSD
ncbi:hypothetical protein QYE76_022959 [Lolium multiflorum]|uniref:RING-type E3 ubiquitin transferase n=1 Tax=Lolium multiflorum TaxID=4521 RepID=A0AAD8RBY3_LOLMU|nr:hypothetical protein QYE76_022959 [Lolium multiflorum]